MIRPATHDDVPRLVELGTLLHQTSCYSEMGYSAEKVEKHLRALIDGLGVVFAAEVDGKVVGGFAGAVAEQWFSNDLIAFDYSVFIEPGRRQGILASRLILTFKEWARIKGAKQIHMGITTAMNVEGTARLYRHLGFREAGPLFKMEI